MNPNFIDVGWRELIAMTPVQLEAYADQMQAVTSRIVYDGDLEQAAALKAAGWTPEPVTPHSLIMAWYWRRPGPKGGTVFKSTTQAFNALKRTAAKKAPASVTQPAP